MAMDIVVPTLGESVSEATVAQWLKQPGQAVALDEPLVELETDKVTLEVNASVAGVLTEILAPEGENVEEGALLHVLAFGRQDLGQHAGHAGVDLQGHLVGLQLHQGLVQRDRLARLLQPLGHGRFTDRFAQGRHHDIHRHLRLVH